MATALVTGGNRGLGLETCRQLARDGLHVILTARTAEEGRSATATLQKQKLDVVFEPLDVSDDDSVASLAERLSARGESLDVLVNNAGMSMKGFDANVAERTTAVNFGGAMTVTETLLPALRDGGHLVMVSSGMGTLGSYSPALVDRFMDPSLTRDALVALVAEFVRDVRDGTHTTQGWPTSAYGVSKAAMNAYVRILAPELRARKIVVTAICPGWVRTDMGGPSASRTVELGAHGIVWAALKATDKESGGFFRDGERIDW